MRLVCFSLWEYDLFKRLIQHNHPSPRIPENLQSVCQQIIDLPGVILEEKEHDRRRAFRYSVRHGNMRGCPAYERTED